MRRGAQRGVAAVEAAIGVAIFGSLLAVAVPAFVRELHLSRFAEPVGGLERIGEAAIEYAHDKSIAEAFPPPVGLTPAAVPCGKREIDPPGIWDGPTWRALQFRAAPEGVPHAFAFAFDRGGDAAASTFVAHAHGDLDGDGATSTFELRGRADASGAAVAPGMFVDAELE